jgi:hypothetical protein
MSESNVTEETTEARGARKTREGLVVSDKMDKTVVVSVEDRVKHALYGKVLRRSTRLKAVRKDIARIYTLMRERELGIETVESA